MSAMPTRMTGRKWEIARRKAQRSLAQISAEEDAALTQAAVADPDDPITDEQMFASMRPATEVAPEIVRRARRQINQALRKVAKLRKAARS